MKWLYAYYPFEASAKEKWNTILIISLFCSVILFILQPYGFAPFLKYKILLGYSVIGIMILVINYFGFSYFYPALFEENKWSVLKAFLFFVFNFIIIGCWIHVYNATIIKMDYSILTSWIEMGMTIAKNLIIGTIASSFLILVRYNVITRKNLQAAQELNQHFQNKARISKQGEDKIGILTFTLENRSFEVPADEILYISSESNYVSFHLSNDSIQMPKLLRGRIKDIETQLKNHTEFFKCHRSYIVNTMHIESTEGNSQGLSIRLDTDDISIPVARSRIRLLKKVIDPHLL